MSSEGFDGKVNLPQFNPPKVPLPLARAVVIVGLVALGVTTSMYQVGPDERGVVRRFGAYVSSTPPGLHFKLPFGIDQVIRVPVQRQLTEEFGFETRQAGVRSNFNNDGFADEAHMLTGDLNEAVVHWVVQYRIVDPHKYLFEVRRPRETFRDMSEAVMRAVVGDRTVNEVITVGRQQIATVVLEQLQVLCDQYETGIQVDQVVLQDVTPPDPVQPAFNEVNQAEQERAKLISQAQSEYNKVVPRAKGEAEQTIQEAEGYALDRVNRAEGEASRFVSVYDEYRKAPEVTRRRIYLETLREVLPKVGKQLIVDESLEGVVPLINLTELTGSKGGGE